MCMQNLKNQFCLQNEVTVHSEGFLLCSTCIFRYEFFGVNVLTIVVQN